MLNISHQYIFNDLLTGRILSADTYEVSKKHIWRNPLMKKRNISITVATSILLAPMVLGLVSSQTPATVTHASSGAVAKASSSNALANWIANTPSHIKQQIQSQGIDPSNAKAAIYTIQWGDTLWGISQATGITIDQLAADNHIVNRDLIFAGAKLTLNGSAKAQSFVQNAPGQSADSKLSVAGNTSKTGTASSTTIGTRVNTNQGTSSTAPAPSKSGTSSISSTSPSGTETSGSGIGHNAGAGSSAVKPSSPSAGSSSSFSSAASSTPAASSSAATPSTPSTSSSSSSSAATPSTPSTSSSSSSSAATPSKPSTSSSGSSSAEKPSTPSTGSSSSTAPSEPSTPTGQEADVTIKAITSDGTVIKTVTLSGFKVGSQVTESSDVVATYGYDLADSNSKTVTVGTTGATITFVFKKNDSPSQVGKTYKPNVEHIKELVMAKYNLAAKGKYWGKPAGKAGADGTIIGNDGAFYMPVPEWWPKTSNPDTSDEEIAESIYLTRVVQSEEDPTYVSAVIDTLTATGSTTINPNGTVSGRVEVYMHMTWYQKF